MLVVSDEVVEPKPSTKPELTEPFRNYGILLQTPRRQNLTSLRNDWNLFFRCTHNSVKCIAMRMWCHFRQHYNIPGQAMSPSGTCYRRRIASSPRKDKTPQILYNSQLTAAALWSKDKHSSDPVTIQLAAVARRRSDHPPARAIGSALLHRDALLLYNVYMYCIKSWFFALARSSAATFTNTENRHKFGQRVYNLDS